MYWYMDRWETMLWRGLWLSIIYMYIYFFFPSQELKKVPGNIPPDVVKLDLSNNKMNQLRPKEFEDMNDLKVLNLSSNGIVHIDPGE